MYKDKLFITVIVLTLSYIIYHTAYNAQNACFYMDDYWWGMYTGNNFTEKIFDSLNFNLVHGGGYIGLFLCKFFSFGLPNMLGIHPLDFMAVPQGIIRGVIGGVILYCISFSFSKNLKLKPFKYFILPSVLIYYFYAIYSSGSVWSSEATIIATNYAWYRYFFSILFFCIFWNYIYKNLFIKYSKIRYLELFTACFSGYVVASSSEISFIATSVAFFLILASKFFIKTTNLDKRFFMPFLAFFITMTAFITNNKFNEVLNARLADSINFSIIKDFIFNYFKICFANEFLYWIIFTFLALSAIIYSIRKNEIKRIIFPFIIQFSILITMMSLVVLGKTFYEDKLFWLSHHNIQFLYKMLILIPFLILLDYNVKIYNDNRLIQKVGITVYSILVLSFCLRFKDTDLFKECYLTSWPNMLRKFYYVSEKILNYYYYKNSVPFLPEFPLDPVLQFYVPNKVENTYNYYKDYIFTDVYYQKIYKNRLPVNIGYFKITDIEALKYFYENGGSFTLKELEELKFQNLLDKDFVLNKKEDAMNFEEAKKYILNN